MGGAIGGFGGGKTLQHSDMGTIGNILAGAAGGLGGGQLLGGLLGGGAAMAGGLDLGALAGNFIGGGVSGLVVQVVVGMMVQKLRD
ncbi:hypothetical protein SAMN04515673_103133 [Poseidonocella sedimentorum]|uniref:DNA methyltransferase n=1 Tax=Poseidonocella sedimentorum TaxID=871652 RepID=A0A1I6DFQ0_9RHOB|nr:hypothetical protein SAMN04515673_103133 [Poseidonocella sedimentorum]